MASGDQPAGYPGVQAAKAGEQPVVAGYPGVQAAAYPAPQAGYAPQQATYPPQQPGYPPQQAGYPPQQQAGYPGPQGSYNGVQTAYAGPQPAYAGPQPGHASMAVAVTMSSAAVPHKPVVGQVPQQVDDGTCGCEVGWILFGIGWLVWVTWVVGAFLPLCDPTQRTVRCRRSAWIGNLTMAIIGTIFWISIIALGASGRFRTNSTYYYYYG